MTPHEPLVRQREQEIPLRTIETEAVAAPQAPIIKFNPNDRRHFIGGSDARTIMGADQDALVRLWREKRGEVEPEDLSDNLIVQLGTVTEVLNRAWYQRSSGQTIKDIQKRIRPPVHKWMGATLDGMIEQTGAVFEAKFMLPWPFTEEAAAEKHMAQLQHNMWVTAARNSVLSIITGGGKWVEIKIHADPLYQHLLLTAEEKFWRCVQSGNRRSSSTSRRRAHDWRRSRSSMCRPLIFGQSWPLPISGPERRMASTKRPNRNSRN